MKTITTNFNSLAEDCKNQNENRAFKTGKRPYSILIVSRSLFIALLSLVYINVHAQNPPSANIFGPLKAHTTDGLMFVTAQITGDGNPTVAYKFENNESGASILSRSALRIDNSTGLLTQTVVINPGTTKGHFNITVVVTSPYGIAESSKSVTVLK